MLKKTKRKLIFNWEVISLLTKINILKPKFWSASDMHVTVKSEMDTEMDLSIDVGFCIESLVYISHVWDQHFQELFIDFSDSNYVMIYLLKYNTAHSASVTIKT